MTQGQESRDQELAVQVKRALRRRMSTLRKALPVSARQARSARIVELLAAHEWFVRASGVALFAAMADRGEVELQALDQLAREQGKRVYYPFMDRTEQGFRTGFRQVAQISELCLRGQKFVEPDPAVSPATADEIDLIVVPALAVSADGHRIGSGSGFYDVTLPDFPEARSCAVVFSFQLVAEVPSQPFDHPCDLVLSDQGFLPGG